MSDWKWVEVETRHRVYCWTCQEMVVISGFVSVQSNGSPSYPGGFADFITKHLPERWVYRYFSKNNGGMVISSNRFYCPTCYRYSPADPYGD